ncbi:TonB-dependent receptor plug domain-containing protein, partial [Bradyrhizobium oligotrophicum]
MTKCEGRRDRTGMRGALALMGVLTADVFCSPIPAHAQATLPPVTVDAPAPKRKPATAAGTPQRRAQMQASRRAAQPPAMPSRAERAAAEAAVLDAAKLNYRAMPSATTLRTGASPLDTAQSVNVVPSQVLKDQLPRNIDDALANISGVTQGNTLAGTQDAVMRRGFGDNRDGSIMRNG